MLMTVLVVLFLEIRDAECLQATVAALPMPSEELNTRGVKGCKESHSLPS